MKLKTGKPGKTGRIFPENHSLGDRLITGFGSSVDAYRGFQRYNRPRRCGFDRYTSLREEFNFCEYLKTNDLAILQYAMHRKIVDIETQRRGPELLTQEEAERLENIMKHCPCEKTKSYAKRIFEMAKMKETTANQ